MVQKVWFHSLKFVTINVSILNNQYNDQMNDVLISSYIRHLRHSIKKIPITFYCQKLLTTRAFPQKFKKN